MMRQYSIFLRVVVECSSPFLFLLSCCLVGVFCIDGERFHAFLDRGGMYVVDAVSVKSCGAA